MAIDWTTRTKTSISALQIGDRISCEYTAAANAFGAFANLGKASKAEIPVSSTATPDGTFYFICVGYTTNGKMKLIADRNIQHSISWDTLNTAGIASGSGLPITMDGKQYTLGLLSGGISSTDTDNEWNKIIVESNLIGTITPGDNDVWNWATSVRSWTKDTPTNGNTYRTARGLNSSITYFIYSSSYDNSSVNGFRPVLLVEPMQNSYLFLKEDKTCYAYKDGKLQQIAADWTALTDAQKKDAFASASQEVPGIEQLQTLNKFKVLVYSQDANENVSCMLRAVPKSRLILPKSLISAVNVTHFKKAELTGTFSGQGVVHMVVTNDLSTYKTYDGTKFIDCIKITANGKQKFENGAWVDTDDAEIAAHVKANGITPTVLASIPGAAWDGFIIGSAGYGFAYLPTIEASSDVCANDKIAVTLMKNGKYRKAVHPTEYDVEYDTQDHVILKQSGDWEILYIS